MSGAVLIIIMFTGGNGMPAATSIRFRSMQSCEETAARIKELRTSNWNNSIIMCAKDN